MSAELQVVLDRVGQWKAADGGYIARCPAHKDRRPSLSIRESNTGKLLLNCFAGCRFESIIAALGLASGNMVASGRVSRPIERFPSAENKATAAQTNAAYVRLLDELPLTAQHADHLTGARGLEPDTVARNLYGSTVAPDAMQAVVDRVAADVELQGVPGFFMRGGRWCAVPTEPGIYIPARDHKRLIVGLQIRRDEPGDGPKYIWFSSKGRLRGTSSGSPAHHALPHLGDLLGKLIVTEGPLKCDIIAERLHVGVIGLAGIASFGAAFGANLRGDFPAVRRVLIAPDSDFRENQAVATSTVRLGACLERAGFAVSVMTWAPEFGKGLDDLLLRAEVA
jgi:DNA primase